MVHRQGFRAGLGMNHVNLGHLPLGGAVSLSRKKNNWIESSRAGLPSAAPPWTASGQRDRHRLRSPSPAAPPSSLILQAPMR
ncbi:hypothetical protein CC78DRAFT_357314 [Lojkania enalia]|uniref:Uncharacterized protein n=1 Tax=Lojkania enalia TaxID=147567 RepID=A0A9P4MXJ5_9PLEO|nr:hypothetical protein CC78DRAFT_357314 [Didymosphaeria enalia]